MNRAKLAEDEAMAIDRDELGTVLLGGVSGSRSGEVDLLTGSSIAGTVESFTSTNKLRPDDPSPTL